MMRISQLRPLRSKRSMFIVGAAILLLIASIGGYTFWSKQVWADYTPMYTQRYQDVQSDIKKTVSLPVTNAKEQDVVLSQYKNISSRIATEQKTVCMVNVWVEWQHRLISSYKDAQNACQKKTADITAFQKQLDITALYIDNDQALAEIISTTTPAGKSADSAWEGQVSLWSDAIAATTKLPVSEAFKPTQQRAIEKMSAVKHAWTEVIVAHQQKDRTKYLAAQSALGASYDGLSSIAEESGKNMKGLADKLNNAYVMAFN